MDQWKDPSQAPLDHVTRPLTTFPLTIVVRSQAPINIVAAMCRPRQDCNTSMLSFVDVSDWEILIGRKGSFCPPIWKGEEVQSI